MSCHRTPPQPPPTFDIAPSSLLPETVDVLSRSRSLRDKIISSVTPATANFSNVLQPLIDHENEALSRLKVLTLFATVAEDPALRDASRAAEKLVFEAEAEAFMSEGIAKLVAVVFESWREGKEELDAQDQHFLKRRHGEYLRNGLGIKDGKQRVRFLNLVTELNSLLSLARKTLSEAEGGIWLSEDDLVGVPAAVLLSMKHRSDIDGAKKDRFCSFRKGHYVPVMRQCTSAKSRKKLYFAKQNQFKENVGRLQKILEIRDEIARILGFKNHAELKLEEKMTESIGDMEIQLSEWRERLQPIAQSEIQRMLKLKSQVLECTKPQQESQNPDNLYFWDWSFYSHLLKKDKYAVNTSKISEYFEVTQTLHNMLSIFDKLFGIKFKQTKGNVWQKDVVMYTVWDNELQGSSFLGHLYFDLFAREGKYEGAHHAMIQPSYTDGNGIRHHAADALICSFLKTASQPTLLMMNEVRTMFHELGHCIHFLVSKARYGLYPSRDFIEIPSIMLENWIWIPEVLKSLGRHYSYLNEELHTLWKENGGLEQEETLSDALIKDLLQTKNLNGAHDMLSQLHAAAFDLAIHTPPTHEAAKVMDTTDMWNRMKRDIVGLESDDEVAPGVGQAGFPHIFRKYDAGYFAYPLSRVWAADLYSSAFAADPMNSATGQRYRKIVLEPGAGVSEAGILKEFLGRNPSSEAYFAEIIEGVERG